ncbi:MAG: FAD-dependent oxidoreductase [Acidobacteriota bacterium]
MNDISRRSFLGSVGAGAVAPTPARPVAPANRVTAVRLTRATLPVLRSGEVVIAGGSFAGVAAALELARVHRKVVLVEPRTYLGREATATLRPWVARKEPLPAVVQACTGVENPFQYLNPYLNPAALPAITYTPSGHEIALKLDKVKLSLEDQLLAAGVELIYASFPVGLYLEGKALAGLIIGNKSGRQILPCRMILDTTETAVVARLAGAAFEPSPGGAQFTRTIEFEGVQPLGESSLPVPAELGIAGDRVALHRGYRGEGHVLVECALSLPVGDFEPADAMRREIEARRRTMQVASHLVNQAPAFHKAFLAATSYELSGPHTSPMKGPAPEWAGGLGSVEAPALGADGRMPLAALAGPVRGVWCLEAARVKPSQTALLRDAVAAALVGEAFAKAAAAHWDAMSSGAVSAEPAAPPAVTAAAGELEVMEPESPQRGRRYELRAVPPEEAPVFREVDVLVVGGGTSGATAAAVAAREGVKTLVVEMNPGLGGTGTIAGVDSYWFGRRVGFAARVTEKVKEVHQSIRYDPGKGNTPRWNIEAKMFALLREAEQAGAEVLFNAIATAAIVEGNQVRGAVLATRYGPRAVLAKVTIDATGDGDVAVSAGAESVYCSSMDHFGMWCNFAQFITPGRNTNHFTGSVDTGNIDDATRSILAGRRRGNNCHDHGVYLAARESRHILADTVLTLTDELRQRAWPDVVNIHYSNHDAKGKSCSQWTHVGLIPPHLEIEIPYRILLPKGLENILIGGKAISATHDGLASIRMQADIETLGGIEGLAAAKAVREGKTPRRIDVGELQQRLVQEGILPKEVLTRKLKPRRYTDAELKQLVAAMMGDQPLLAYQKMDMFEVLRSRIPFVEVSTAGPRVVPLLEAALETARASPRVVAAKALALYGSRAAVPTLVGEIEKVLSVARKVPPRTNDINHAGFPPDIGAMPDVVYLIYALGMTRDRRALGVWRRVAEILDPREEDFRDRVRSAFSYVDSVCFGAERLGDPEAIPILERLHAYPTLRDQGSGRGFQPDYFKERQAMCELAIGKALSRCGSAKGVALVIGYLDDNRAALAEQAHSHLVRIAGRDYGKDSGLWTAWLERVKESLAPQPLMQDLDTVYEQEMLSA